MKRPLLEMTIMFILLVSLTGCQTKTASLPKDFTPVINPPLTQPATIASFPTISGRNPQVEEPYQPLAESSSLRLYLNQASSAIVVDDKRSGSLWRSSPADLSGNNETTTAWRKQIEAPVQVTYVDA